MIVGVSFRTKENIMAKYSKAAKKSVESAMKRMEKGKLRSGKSNIKVTNPKQAIAIGLSEARKKGAKVPKKAAPKKTAKKAAAVKATKKAVIKKSAPKKTAAAKKASPSKKIVLNKAVSKKKAPVKKVTARKKEVKKEQEKIVMPAEQTIIDPNLPPVEEKSPEIMPVIPEKIEDPIMVTDKKALAKAVTKHDPKHPMQLSNVKRSIRPSGKKPLWH